MMTQQESPDYKKIEAVLTKADFFNEKLTNFLFRDAKLITLFPLMAKGEKESIAIKVIPFVHSSSMNEVKTFWDESKDMLKVPKTVKKHNSIEKDVIKHYKLENHKANILFFINFFCYPYLFDGNSIIESNKQTLVKHKELLHELITSLKWLIDNINNKPQITFQNNIDMCSEKLDSPELLKIIKGRLLEQFVEIDRLFMGYNEVKHEKVSELKRNAGEGNEDFPKYFSSLEIGEWEDYFLLVFGDYQKIAQKSQEKYHSEIKWFMDVMQIYLEEYTDYCKNEGTTMSNKQAEIISQFFLKLGIYGDFNDLVNNVKNTLKNFRKKKKELKS